MDTDNDDVEEEYEEYEEIEVEVEEEVEEEEEEDDVENQSSASPDVSEGTESKGSQEHEEHLISDSVDPVVGSTAEPKSSIASETKNEVGVYVEDHKSLESGNHFGVFDNEELVDDKKDPIAPVEREAQDKIDANSKALVDHGCVITEPSVISGKEAAISTKNGLIEGAKVDVDVETNTKRAGEQSTDSISKGHTSFTLPQTRLRSLSPGTDLDAMNKKPAVMCNFFAKGWCIKGDSCKFLHVKDPASQNPEGSGNKSELASDIGLGKRAERSEAISSPMATVSPVTFKRSQSRELGESQHFPHTYSTPSPHVPISGALPLFSASRARFLVGSFGKDPFDTIGSSSLLRSSSTFSSSESKIHSLKDFSMDPLPVAGPRTTISLDDWEPSKPFQPSFQYTKNLLSPSVLYDPIRDSIEQPNTTDQLSKFPLRPEKTATPTCQSTDNDPVLQKTNQPEYGSDNLSISGHQKLNVCDKDLLRKYSLPTEGETMGTNNDVKNSGSNSPKEEKASRGVLGKDKAEMKKGFHDSTLQKNGITLKKETEMAKDRRKNELNLEGGRDGEQRESKEMKNFRIALIDFIKELVRPAWLEGRMSKDAHKMVVKKAVEKVLSTVQPHQTPSTEEAIQHYLSISEPKMAKLVEAYVVKYGKS